MPLSAAEIEALARLAPVARTARRQHAPLSPQGRASAEFTQLVTAAFQEGRASVREIATQTGISYHSIARRIRIATDAPIGRSPSPLSAGGADTAPTAQENAPGLTPVPPFPPENPEEKNLSSAHTGPGASELSEQEQKARHPSSGPRLSLVPDYEEPLLPELEVPDSLFEAYQAEPAPAPAPRSFDPFTSGWNK